MLRLECKVDLVFAIGVYHRYSYLIKSAAITKVPPRPYLNVFHCD